MAHVDLYFFLDADIAILAFEMSTATSPIDRVQDTLFRFGRAYPAYWDAMAARAIVRARSNGWSQR